MSGIDRNTLKDPDARFRQAGVDGVMSLTELVQRVKGNGAISLVEPAQPGGLDDTGPDIEAIELQWSPQRARLWAADCAEDAVDAICLDEGDAQVLKRILGASRQYAEETMTADVVDAEFTELFLEDWARPDPAFLELVQAVALAVGRDRMANSPWGQLLIRPGYQPSDAANKCVKAVRMHSGADAGDALRARQVDKIAARLEALDPTRRYRATITPG